MSAPALRGAVVRRVGDRSWQLTVTAGALALAGLTIALNGGTRVVILGLVGTGIVIGACVLVPRAIASARRARGWGVPAALITVVALWFVLWIALWFALWIAGATESPLAAVAALLRSYWLPLLAIPIAAGAAMVLIADAVRILLGLAPRQRAPWKHMTERAPRAGGIAWRVVTGVALVGWAGVLALTRIARQVAGDLVLEALALLLIVAAAAIVLGVPVVIGAFMRVRRDRAGSESERERQRFAAHLHDSVLQTLSLVQRQAHDPVAVARLARRQEHALRAWMAGEAELAGDTLVAALRDAVESVEDEHPIAIEFSAIGDRTLDPSCEDLVAAAREALRNAARHAGAVPVFVFCQVASDGAVELFIRDEGPGFAPTAVPAERRGIRDAIVGRMRSAGGEAQVESMPGEGTEVALRLPARRGSR